MRNLGQAYFNAVTDYGREWDNQVVITDGTHTETYTSCEISIEEVMSESENLSMGKSFTKELTLKVFEPLRTVSYKNSKITVNSKLKVGNSYTTVKMGEYYANEVTTSDDYATLDIKAYDFMAKLQEEYEPTVTLPCTQQDIVEDIATQYNFEISDNIEYIEGTVRAFNQLLNPQYLNTVVEERYTCTPNVANGSVTITALTSGTTWFYFDLATFTNPIQLKKGHKYLLKVRKADGYMYLGASAKNGSDTVLSEGSITTINADTQITRIVCDDGFYVGSGDSETIYPQVFDLTLIYGAGNEPNYVTFKTDYPNVYYSYVEMQNPVYSGLWFSTLYEGTVAETLGYMAGLQGKNAVFDMDGKLAFRWYTESSLYGDTWNDYNGITWNEMTQRWGELGGSNVVGRENQKENGLTINEGSFTIQSITSGSGDNALVVGTGKGITFECPYMTQALLNAIGNRVLNSTYRIGKIDTFGNPMIEVGDIVNVIDKEGNFNVCYCSNITWGFSGGCNSSIQSVGNPDAEIEFSTESPTEKKINTVKSGLQEAKEQLSQIINTTEGVYSITVEDGVTKGWTIVDNVDNPRKVVKATLGGIAIGKNGLDGVFDTAITGDGIVANTITSGTMTVGGTNNVALTVKNSSNNTIGEWGTSGVGIYAGTIHDANNFITIDVDTGTITSKDNGVRGSGRIRCEKIGDSTNFVETYSDGVLVQEGSSKHTHIFPSEIQCVSGSNQVEINTLGQGSGSAGLTVDMSTGGYCIRTYSKNNIAYSGAWQTSSARKYKKNIESYSGCAVDKINDIDVVSFNYKTDENDEIRIGFIADDTDEIFATKNHDTMDLNNCIGMLLKAVQELSAEVEDLKSQLNGVEKGDSEE